MQVVRRSTFGLPLSAKVFRALNYVHVGQGLGWIENAAKPTGIVLLVFPLGYGLPCKQPLTLPIIQSCLYQNIKLLTFIPARFHCRKILRDFPDRNHSFTVNAHIAINTNLYAIGLNISKKAD